MFAALFIIALAAAFVAAGIWCADHLGDEDDA